MKLQKKSYKILIESAFFNADFGIK